MILAAMALTVELSTRPSSSIMVRRFSSSSNLAAESAWKTGSARSSAM
jgi:hypothetical protein